VVAPSHDVIHPAGPAQIAGILKPARSTQLGFGSWGVRL
jgi:hypothetical protein